MGSAPQYSQRDFRQGVIATTVAALAVWLFWPDTNVAILSTYLSVFGNVAMWVNVRQGPDWAQTAHISVAVAPIFIWRLAGLSFAATMLLAVAVAVAVQASLLYANRDFWRANFADTWSESPHADE